MIYNVIDINENYNELINDSLLIHIAIDYINESNQYLLLEKYGLYDGCIELVNFIIKKIKAKFNHKEQVFKLEFIKNNLKFNNIFFKKLELTVEFVKNITTNGLYNIDSKFDKETLLIDNVKIEIKLNINSFNHDIKSILYHELTHAWDDYNSYLQNKEGLLKVIKNTKYFNYQNGKLSKNNIKQILSDILYHLNDIEKNAYIAELRADLENNKNIIHGPKEAYDIIKKSIAYKNVMTAKNIIDGLKNNEYNEEITNVLYNYYRELNEVDWSDNKIKKKLIWQIDSYIDKMNKIIPKMCLDFLNNNMKEIKEIHNTRIVPLVEYIKDK